MLWIYLDLAYCVHISRCKAIFKCGLPTEG